MTEAEREFMKWLVADYARVLRQIEADANSIYGGDSIRTDNHLSRIKNLCVNSELQMNSKLAKIPEFDREKWR